MKFDGCGNETLLNGGGVFQVDSLNEYTTFNGVAVGNDTDGNVQSYNGWTYVYDAQNRLREAFNDSTDAHFYYDGLGHPIRFSKFSS